MAPNVFVGKSKKPTKQEVAAALGTANALWDQLLAELEEKCGVADQEWNSYSPKAGWSLKVIRKKRTILWLGPCDGSFRAAFILGAKAMAAARDRKVPAKLLDEAKKYPEGFGIRFETVTAKDIAVICELAKVKVES